MTRKLHLKLAVLFAFASSIVYAQKEITVTSVKKKMSRGEQTGFQVSIPEGKLKDITSAYKKQLETNTKVDVKENGGELVTTGAVNKNFSDKPFTVYSKFLETPEGVDMTVFVSEDNENFISDDSDADKLTALKKSIRDFAVTEYKEIVNEKLDVENDKLKDLKKDLENLVEDESDNIKDISKKQREIENYTTKIETNKTLQASKTEQVTRQQNTVSEISDKKSPEYKLATTNLKEYQSERKSLEKDAEKMGREIDDNKADINKLEKKNEELKKQQATAQEKVDAQDKVVKAIEEELAGIK